MMRADFTDDVSGVIIGEFLQQAILTYEGRKQGPTMYVRTDEDAKQQAQAYIAEQRAECGAAFAMIYPNKAWQIKFI
ncbi:MAG: hypothetical protein ACXW1D_00380 [Halobacteriota archaeon]